MFYLPLVLCQLSCFSVHIQCFSKVAPQIAHLPSVVWRDSIRAAQHSVILPEVEKEGGVWIYLLSQVQELSGCFCPSIFLLSIQSKEWPDDGVVPQ